MNTETPFVFFAAMTVVQFVVVLFVFPETKGQTLEESAAQAGAWGSKACAVSKIHTGMP